MMLQYILNSTELVSFECSKLNIPHFQKHQAREFNCSCLFWKLWAKHTSLPAISSTCTVPSWTPSARSLSETQRQDAAFPLRMSATSALNRWYLSRGSSSSSSSSISSSSLNSSSTAFSPGEGPSLSLFSLPLESDRPAKKRDASWRVSLWLKSRLFVWPPGKRPLAGPSNIRQSPGTAMVRHLKGV